jgi:hypothetical protein
LKNSWINLTKAGNIATQGISFPEQESLAELESSRGLQMRVVIEHRDSGKDRDFWTKEAFWSDDS